MIKLITGDYMNNKGFTLIELLATIVILGIVMGIASYGVISVINKSKLKSEKVFVDKIETAIQGYLSVYGQQLSPNNLRPSSKIFEKCRKINGTNQCNEKTFQELEDKSLIDITKVDIKTINKSDLINPKSKKNCVENDKDPTIRIFKDSDYVYYYYLDLSKDKTSCEITDENAIISNIPENICNKIENNAYEEGKCKL